MRKKRKCQNCGRDFLPNKFNHHHQVYCSDPECRSISRKRAQAKYRKKQSKSLAFRRKESERVKEWQRKHPGYWKDRKKKSKKDFTKKVLQDFASVEKLKNEVSVLRDMAFSQHLVMNGVISYMAGDVLRDNIGELRNRFYDRGKAVLDDMSEAEIINLSKRRMERNEKQETNRSSSKT